MEHDRRKRSFRKITAANRDRKSVRWRRNVLDEDTKWLLWAKSRFESIAGKGTEIDRESFKNALEVENVFFADRFFDMFDCDHSGTVCLDEMMNGLYILTKGTREEKIRFIFDVYDLDDNGLIDKYELRVLLKTGLEETSLSLSDVKLDHLTNSLLTAADKNNDGAISFEEFVEALQGYPDLIENFSISAGAWLRSTAHKKRRLCGPVPCLKPHFLRNNITWIFFMGCVVLLIGLLFGFAAARYSSAPDTNWCFVIARGCGNALNFTCAVVVVLMLRNTLNFLRSSWILMQILPFDDTIQIHKIIGYLSALLAVGHTLGHIGNALILQTQKNFTAVELLFTNPKILEVGLRVGELEGSAFITGWLLAITFIVLIVGSLTFVRRSNHFEIFYWTHKICYIVFWFLLILHGPKFWYWFIGPCVFFLLEKVSETKIIRKLRFGKTYIKEANLLPSGVTHLVMTKPPNFKYKAGDYIFIQIPTIAKHEWHPFTISSAPEQEGIISLHIRSAGNWTKSLYRYFDVMPSAQHKQGSVIKKNALGRQTSRSNLGTVELATPKEQTNMGFEMSSDDDEIRANNPTTPPPDGPNGIHETSVDIADDEASSDLEEYFVPPPEELIIRRMGYPSELDTHLVLLKKNPDIGLPEEIQEKEDDDGEGEGDDDETHEEGPSNMEAKGEDIKSVDVAQGLRKNPASPLGAVLTREDSSASIRSIRSIRSLRKLRSTSSLSSLQKSGQPRSLADRRKSAPSPRANIIFDLSTKNRLQVHIQGPYGTPSTNIFQSEHAVLIGAGIGVTPFAAIVQSIMYRHRTIVNTCPNCTHSWVDEERQKQALRVKKVDFIWLNRNHTAFEWFVDMLLKLETEQSEYSLDRFLDIHLFMTGINTFDMKNFGVQLALDVVHENENRDMLTGLRTKLQSGRPNWSKLFRKIKDERKGKVSVFFCGAPALGVLLAKQCQKFGFYFHKENF